MNEGHASPGALSAPKTAAGSSEWPAARIAALAIGALLALVALALLAAGGTGVWADSTQREGGYVTTDVHEFSTSGSALTTEPAKLGSAGVGWLYSPGLLGKVRIRVTPVSSAPALFVGIGRSTDVDRYLAGVSHTQISEFWQDKVQAIGGSGAPASAPGTKSFWVASATGAGTQSVVWKPVKGSWSVVVMNADARPGIDVKADLGARLSAVLWISIGVLAAGAVFMAGGVLLIVGAIRRRPVELRREE
ncbi:MAG TPA: hypothetical protein VF063_04850 [Gaiellaceae bacterium]